MKVCLFVIAVVAGTLAFVPTPSFADLGPCNSCPNSTSQVDGGSSNVYLVP